MISTSLALSGAELIVRYLYPAFVAAKSDRSFWHHHDLLGWFHTPNETGSMVFKGQGKDSYAVSVKLNSAGFRDIEHSITPAEPNRRILFLGDSFVFGYGVESENIFTTVLRKSGFDALNFGVSGYSNDQEYLLYKEKGLAYKPLIVVMPIISNDFASNVGTLGHGYPKPKFEIQTDGQLKLSNVPVPDLAAESRVKAIDRVLKHNSALYAFLNYRLNIRDTLAGLYYRISGTADPEHVSSSPEEEATYGVAQTNMILAEFVKTARANHAVPVILLAPDTPEHLLAPENKASVAKWCEGYTGCQLFSLYPYFAALSREERQSLYLSDNNHWSNKGHALVAEIFARDLLPELLRQN